MRTLNFILRARSEIKTEKTVFCTIHLLYFKLLTTTREKCCLRPLLFASSSLPASPETLLPAPPPPHLMMMINASLIPARSLPLRVASSDTAAPRTPVALPSTWMVRVVKFALPKLLVSLFLPTTPDLGLTVYFIVCESAPCDRYCPYGYQKFDNGCPKCDCVGRNFSGLICGGSNF